MFACNGILFNHESPRRGGTFVTRKITRGLSNIALGLEDCLHLGNLDAMRDWGHAKDYVNMQWMMLQQDTPDDFVIATGVQHSVREFLTWSAKALGLEVEFSGSGLEEVGKVVNVIGDKAPHVKIGQVIIRVSERYFRPTEVDTLLGDSSKAKRVLGWEASYTAEELCREMIEQDYKLALQKHLLREKGLDQTYSI